MLGTLNRFIVNCSQSWWKILLLFAGQSATLLSLSAISESFPEVTAGDVPFNPCDPDPTSRVVAKLRACRDKGYVSYFDTFTDPSGILLQGGVAVMEEVVANLQLPVVTA